MLSLKEDIKRRLERAEKKVKYIKEKHGDNPSKDFNYWGGRELGHWEGVVSTYDYILGKLEEDKIQ